MPTPTLCRISTYTDYGVRRYGFHGTSHKYVTRQAQKMLQKEGFDPEKTKIVTCHLGNGCSAAAVVGGKVIDTSMGMTPAEGLVMGTRGGDMDPAILVYLAKELHAKADEIDDIINKKSGLLGVTGVSSDMRDVEDAAKDGNKRAELALAIFCYRIKEVCRCVCGGDGRRGRYCVHRRNRGEQPRGARLGCARAWISSGSNSTKRRMRP